MTSFEYKVIPAPTKGTKAPGVKSGEGRFAATVEGTLNAQAADGWEYLRTDILPSDERQGLTGSQTVYRTLMVFRRSKAEGDTAAEDIIQNAQDVAEAARPERREPSLAPVAPSRADPAPKPDVPDTPDAPSTPDTPKTD
ncbi:hypothetical protein SAMN05421666_1601 [Roseovarius nanhaiticus]|uniref:DUF4177 domain-containing protein n=1 Tax=Roseovarius nanhaiticus TaxID=573024 RepID=A0A1N7G2H2_9RHOB|nr:hypothetical protein [Roseovarius nanhaiticus]SEK39118.1 hypothetical protein SAMN05216208_0535 [Roseovarius nanhaiticus]SIS06704.1 hypothetical protein SAMN05421666_1601 [Roseovarius nanhaiticus]